MNKYSLIIEEHIEGTKDFHTRPIISIEGNSLLELLGKLPLEVLRITDKLQQDLNKIKDEDIPF